MNETIEEIQKLLGSASEYVDASKDTLEDLLNTPESEEEGSSYDRVHNLQLILQYRLSAQNILSTLLKIDHNLLAILGVTPEQSARMNLDRLSFALGTDDLQQILNLLGVLIDALLKITNRLQKDKTSFKSKMKNLTQQNRITKGLHKLEKQQQKLHNELIKIESASEALRHTPSQEIIMDHIMLLTGPILKFYHEMLHQLGLTKQLYQLSEVKQPALQEVNVLLKKADEVLGLLPATSKPHPNYTLGHFDHKQATEDLEKRATAKRLRPFF